MNITINNQLLNDIVYINNVQGVHDLPPARALSNAFSTSSGSNYCGSVFDERVIVISCTALMSKGQMLSDKMDSLKTLIAPTGEKEMTFDAYPNRMIKGRYEGSMNLSQLAQMGTFDLTFYCSDPFYYDKALKTASGSTMNLVNDGNWNSKKLTMQLNLNGEARIKNNTTGEQLILEGSGSVTVDFEKACIYGGVAVNANKFYKSGKFFELKPGANSIAITGATATANYRSCYL